MEPVMILVAGIAILVLFGKSLLSGAGVVSTSGMSQAKAAKAGTAQANTTAATVSAIGATGTAIAGVIAQNTGSNDNPAGATNVLGTAPQGATVNGVLAGQAGVTNTSLNSPDVVAPPISEVVGVSEPMPDLGETDWGSEDFSGLEFADTE